MKDLSMHACPMYGAVDENMEDIMLGNVKHQVTRNLYGALKCLRAAGATHNLWIDALSINQRDEVEKMTQVAMMGRIFEEATEVLVWLGNSGTTLPVDDEEQAVAGASEDEVYVADGIEILRQLASGVHFHDLSCFGKCRSRSCPSSRESPERPGKPWRRLLDVLQVIMDTPWFDRTWTIQEIVLASKATFLIDNHCLPWDLIAEAWTQWAYHLNVCCDECLFTLRQSEFESLHRFAAKTIDLLNAKGRRERGDGFLRSALKFKSKHVSNRRDKVYGILGLQSGPAAMKILPDYSLAVEEVFVRFAAEIIRFQDWLVPLH